VLAQSANGTTQVQIGRQTLSLKFPTPPPIGATLTLSLQQTQGQVRVTLVTIQPMTNPSTAAPSVSPSNAPATSVQLSPAALSGSPPQAAPPSAAIPLSAQPPLPSSAPPSNPGAASVVPPQSTAAPQISSGTGAIPAPTQGVPAPPAQPTAPAPNPGTPPIPAATIGSVQTAAVAAPVIAAPAAAVPRANIPYPAAAAAPGAVPNSASVGATTALPPVAASIAGGLVGQHAPQPGQIVPNATGAPTAVAAPPPQTPSSALSQMVQQALPRQDSVIALTSALAGVIGRVALPQEVVKAAQQVLGQALSLDGGRLDGAAIRSAVKNSGIFQEAMLASGQGKAGRDMKSSLLGLQRQLGAWLGDQAPVDQLSRVPPPLKGIIPRARLAPMSPSDLPNDPELAGKILLERTEAALSRIRLHQNASLPEPGAQRSEAQWSLDLPVNIGGQQTLLQMQIHRDPEGDADRPEERGWQVRFAINLSEAGEVGAQISLRGAVTGVLLWAEDARTADLLSNGVDALRSELEAIGLVPGAVVVRAGAPNPPHPYTPQAGNLVDAVS
jgi:hypothetical protein